MSVAHEHLLLQAILTPGAGGSAETNIVIAKGWHLKTFWIIPEGQGVTVDIMGAYALRGRDVFFPFQSYSGGVANADEIFGLTVNGDVMEALKVKVTAGGIAPSQVSVLIYGGRSEG